MLLYTKVMIRRVSIIMIKEQPGFKPNATLHLVETQTNLATLIGEMKPLE